MDVVLHVGAHRTGTTTLQEYLRRNRPQLIDCGVLPVLPAQTRGPLFDGLLQRPGDATPDMRRRAAAARRRVGDELDRAAGAGLKQVLISDENFAGSPRASLVDGVIYPDLADRMRWLGPDLRRRVVRVGFALRRYDDWWASVLAYAVAGGLHVPVAGDAARLALLPRRWPDVVDALATCFPQAEIVLWPFETMVARPAAQVRALTGGVLRGASGGALTGDGGAPSNNASPDAAALRQALSRAGQAAAAALLPESGRWMPFDEPTRATLAAAYADDLARLAHGRGRRIRLIGGARTPIDTMAALPRASARSEEGRQHGQHRFMA